MEVLDSSAAGDARRLEKRILDLARPLGGRLGLAFLELEGAQRLLIDAHESFPAASLLKIPILMELYQCAARGELNLDSPIRVEAADLVGGAGVIQFLKPGHLFSLRELAWLAVVVSDNLASNLLIRVVGLDRINQGLERMGLHSTRMNRKFMQEPAAPESDNLTTPHDMAQCLAGLYHSRFLPPAQSREILEIMSHQQFTEMIPSRLPQGIRVANKTGLITASRLDAAVVFLPGAPYVLCVCAADLAPESLAERVIADISWEIFAWRSPGARPR